MIQLHVLPAGANPSCLQATLASKVDQKPSQMVPQVSFQQSSTRPSSSVFPPASLRSPLLQMTMKNINEMTIINHFLICSSPVTLQVTPASLEWVHVVVSLLKPQSTNRPSSLVHTILVPQMGPVPSWYVPPG